MVTLQPTGKSSADVIHRIWRATALPLIGVGLALWTAGIVADFYWLIVAGTLTIAAGAYKITDR